MAPAPRDLIRATLYLAAALLSFTSPAPVLAATITCDQSPVANTVISIGCSLNTDPCTVVDFTAPAGCVLDFGTRTVVFKGTFDVGSAALTVSAGTIRVDGQLRARSDGGSRGGALTLKALGDLVVTGRLDVVGNPAGLIRLNAGGKVDLQATAALVADGRDVALVNGASGGTIDISAGTGSAHVGSATHNAAMFEANGGAGGGGGSVTFFAADDIVLVKPITATGGVNDGGDIDLLAGGNIAIDRTLDVTSTTGGGGGGSIRARAGVDALDGGVGGNLNVTGNLIADGSSDPESGFDGGDITLSAFGTVTVASGATIRAIGGSPDGSGGSLSVDSGDSVLTRIDPLHDGDITLAGPVIMRGPGVESDGGDLDATAGRDLLVTGAVDLDGGSGGGDFTVTAGRNIQLNGAIADSGLADSGGGGSVTARAGFGDSTGTLTVAGSIDVRASINGSRGDVLLAGCNLTIQPNVIVDATATTGTERPPIDLAASGTMHLGAGSDYIAAPAGRVRLIHRADRPPVIGANVTFQPPPPVDDTTSTGLFPPCPVCGDGIHQPGEVCDNGLAAEGSCCNADCSAITCPTATRTPTATPTATGPTRSPTPTSTRTRTPTPTRTGPTPTPTATVEPPLPAFDPKTVLACERALGKSTTRFALTDLTVLELCSMEAFKCVQGRAPGPARDSCLANAAHRCNTKRTKLTSVRDGFLADLDAACGGAPTLIPLALMRSPELLAFQTLEPACAHDTGIPGLRLSSFDAIRACVQLGTACSVEEALGTALPRAGDMLSLVSDAGVAGLCVPGATGDTDGLTGLSLSRAAVRCQTAVSGAARKLLARQLDVGRRCVDSLLACRLTGRDAAICARVGARCHAKLAELANPTTGGRAKLTATVEHACTGLDATALLGAAGMGYDAVVGRCADLGFRSLADPREIGECMASVYGCKASAVLRHALPLVDGELARVGLRLDDDPFCAPATPTATVTATPTVTVSPTPSPTVAPAVTATPTAMPGGETPTPAVSATPTPQPSAQPTSTPVPVCGNGVLEGDEQCDDGNLVDGDGCDANCTFTGCGNGIATIGEQCDDGNLLDGDGCDQQCAFELLVPGGGIAATDCLVEWAVVNPLNNAPLAPGAVPDNHQYCTDGDPSCDADGQADGTCHFRVAICLGKADASASDPIPPDPNLPSCILTPPIVRFTLESPRPDSSDGTDIANAVGLLDAFGRLGNGTPGGTSMNTLTFEPALDVDPPYGCTSTVALAIELRTLDSRSEKFLDRVLTEPPPGLTGGLEDRDALILTCDRPLPPSP